jgi:hypothetical protein
MAVKIDTLLTVPPHLAIAVGLGLLLLPLQSRWSKWLVFSIDGRFSP